MWDVDSCQKAHFEEKIIGTSSFAIADSFGYQDGEKMPLKLLLSSTKSICDKTMLPVSIDIEQGYCGGDMEKLKNHIAIFSKWGVNALNIEDLSIDRKSLLPIKTFCDKLKAIKEVAPYIFVNARSDIFFLNNNKGDSSALVQEAIKRGNEYAKVGADCFFYQD